MPIQAVQNRRLYQQIADRLRTLIETGEYTPGSTLPWLSLTTPEIDAVDCASAAMGLAAMTKATASAILLHQAERDILFLPRAPGRVPPLERRYRLADELNGISREVYALGRVTIKRQLGTSNSKRLQICRI